MQNRKINKPYQELGDFLREKREKNHESIIDVSSAVEIEPNFLEIIEAGSERPSEDILVLLINHFNLKDSDAMTVWKLADYDDNNNYDFTTMSQQGFKNDIVSSANVVMVMPIDVRPMYSDHVEIVEKSVAMNLTGIESLSLIPGTAGSTVIQNVGAYGQEMSKLIKSVKTLDRTANLVKIWSNSECQFNYRSSRFNKTPDNPFQIISFELAFML